MYFFLDDEQMQDSEGRTPLQLAADPAIRRLVQTEEVVRISSESFDLLEAVEVNDTSVSFFFFFSFTLFLRHGLELWE